MNKKQDFTIKLDSPSESKTWLSGKILNDEDNLIGNIKGPVGIHTKILWLKLDDSVLISSELKGLSLRTVYEIKDPEGILLGTVKGKGMLGNQMRLQNLSGINILTSKKVDSSPLSYEIKNEEEKIIANMKIMKDKTLKGIFSINETSFDELLLLGFFVTLIGNFVYERLGVGGG